MKEVYKYEIYMKKHNSEKWINATNFNHFVYKERPEDLEINLETIADVEDVYQHLNCTNLIVERKFFSKKKRIVLLDGTKILIMADDKQLQECGGLDVLFTYKPVYCLTIRELSKYLSAEQFMDYVKDNQ